MRLRIQSKSRACTKRESSLWHRRLACVSTAETAVPQDGTPLFRHPIRYCRIVAGVMSAGLLVSAGCAHINNPYKDSGAAIDDEMTTASAEGSVGKAEFASVMRRSWPAEKVYYENGAVSHWPLWFEDPFEDKGNGPTVEGDLDPIDNRFAWSWEDYLHIGYGPGRIFLNTVAWPISAVVTPPGTLMESDGRISKGLLWYDHDAKRSDSVTREPPDVSPISKPRFSESGGAQETAGRGE